MADKRYEVMGCPVDALTLEETLEKIDRFIADGKPRQHVVINAAKLVEAHRNPELRRVLANCDLINADGMPIVWAAKLLGIPVTERITGCDLMEYLVERSASKDHRVYFFGAEPDIVREVAEIYAARYPGLNVAGYHHGFFKNDEEEVVFQQIAECRPDILFAALPSPRKEYLLSRLTQKTSIPFSMGVGGSFDVVAGKVRRAPVWMQNLGLEWVVRLVQEPKRMWRRYLIGNPQFAWLLIQALWRKWRRQPFLPTV